MIKHKAKPSPRPTKIIKPAYRNLIIVFAILAVILVISILYFALSQATINITPVYAQQEVGFVVQLIDQNSPQAQQNVAQKIPGLLVETTIEEEQNFTAKQLEIIQEKASGKITIYNDYSQAQPLMAKTRFQSPQGLIFRITEGVTIPAKSNLEVTVVADEAGEKYEIGPEKFFLPALSEWRRQNVYAKSFEPFTRKATQQFQITQEVIDQAKKQFETELLLKSKEELTKNLSSGKTIAEPSLTSDTIKFSVSEKVNSQKESFTISLALAVKALVFNEEELKTQAFNSLPDSYKQTSSLTKIDPNSLTYEIVFLDENSENLLAQIKGQYNLNVANINIDKSYLKGLTKKEALSYLGNISDIKEVSIRLPFWTKFLPTLDDHINIVINE